MNQFPPGPKYPIRAISNFTKIRRDIHNLVSADVVDTSDKSSFTGVNNGRLIIASVFVTGNKLLPLLLASVNKLCP